MGELYESSYENYRKIVRIFKESGKYMDYPYACGAKEFLVLHHDVEFSLDKAYTMAKIEAEE